MEEYVERGPAKPIDIHPSYADDIKPPERNLLYAHKRVYAYLRVGGLTLSLPSLVEAQNMSQPKHGSVQHMLSGAFFSGYDNDFIDILHTAPGCGSDGGDFELRSRVSIKCLEGLRTLRLTHANTLDELKRFHGDIEEEPTKLYNDTRLFTFYSRTVEMEPRETRFISRPEFDSLAGRQIRKLYEVISSAGPMRPLKFELLILPTLNICGPNVNYMELFWAAMKTWTDKIDEVDEIKKHPSHPKFNKLRSMYEELVDPTPRGRPFGGTRDNAQPRTTGPGVVCYVCDKAGHDVQNCKARFACTLCAGEGHCEDGCPEWSAEKDGKSEDGEDYRMKELLRRLLRREEKFF